jgi:sugar phosphate isomerase/epimerase
VIDTYSHAFNSRSEDGNAKAIEFARRIRHLMHEVGCSVVLLDHTGYQQTDEPRDASAKRQAGRRRRPDAEGRRVEARPARPASR